MIRSIRIQTSIIGSIGTFFLYLLQPGSVTQVLFLSSWNLLTQHLQDAGTESQFTICQIAQSQFASAIWLRQKRSPSERQQQQPIPH